MTGYPFQAQVIGNDQLPKLREMPVPHSQYPWLEELGRRLPYGCHIRLVVPDEIPRSTITGVWYRLAGNSIPRTRFLPNGKNSHIYYLWFDPLPEKPRPEA